MLPGEVGRKSSNFVPAKITWQPCGCHAWRCLAFLSGHAGPEMEASLLRGLQRALGLRGHLLGVWLDFMVLAVWMICRGFQVSGLPAERPCPAAKGWQMLCRAAITLEKQNNSYVIWRVPYLHV